MAGDKTLHLLVDVKTKNLDGLDAVAGRMTNTGNSLTRGLTLPIVGAGIAVLKLASDAEESMAKLTAAFDTSNAASWTSVDALTAQAEALDKLSTFDDEAFLEAQATILKFDNITGPVFDDLLVNAADMAVAMGTDLTGASDLLGRALNDPLKAFKLLRTAGVDLNDGLEDQIRLMVEQGDTAGAQALINDALAESFGGADAAMAGTNSGKLAESWQQIQNAGEGLGEIILPIVSKFAEFLGNLAEKFKALSPTQQDWIVKIGLVVAAVGPALIIGGKLVSAFGSISKAFSAMSALMALNPWVLLIAAVVALVVLIVLNWDKIVAVLKVAWDWIVTNVKKVADWIMDKLKAAWDFVVALFKVSPLGFLITHFDDIKEAATKVWKWIVEKFTAVTDFFKGLGGKIGDAFSKIGETILGPFKWAFNKIAEFWNKTVGAIKFTTPEWFPGDPVTWSVPKIPLLSGGGIAMGPTLAMIGEAGPEAVIPLSRLAGNQGNTYSITVEAGVGDPVEIGKAIVEAVRAFERSSGLDWRAA